MKKIAERLWVGTDDSYTHLITDAVGEFPTGANGWCIVHAAREPYHREFVGYRGKGAPKESPEYLYAQRGKRLALNLFDTDDVNYVNDKLMEVAVSWARTALQISQDNVLIHCNKGLSRGPTLAMLVMARDLSNDYQTARGEFEKVYPEYNPMQGLQDYARLNWSKYHEGIT